MTDIEIDWSRPSKEPGIRKAKIIEAEGKSSKKGDPMLAITFELEGGGRVLDFIMLGGDGKEMGLDKLERLGVQAGSKRFNPGELVGITLSIFTILSEWDGRESLKVDGKANTNGFRLGYGSDVVIPKPDFDNAAPF